jgi:hypothetical protein
VLQGGLVNGLLTEQVKTVCVDLCNQELLECIPSEHKIISVYHLANQASIISDTIRSLLRGRRPLIHSEGGYVSVYFYAGDGAETYMMLVEQRPGQRIYHNTYKVKS